MSFLDLLDASVAAEKIQRLESRVRQLESENHALRASIAEGEHRLRLAGARTTMPGWWAELVSWATKVEAELQRNLQRNLQRPLDSRAPLLRPRREHVWRSTDVLSIEFFLERGRACEKRLALVEGGR